MEGFVCVNLKNGLTLSDPPPIVVPAFCSLSALKGLVSTSVGFIPVSLGRRRGRAFVVLADDAGVDLLAGDTLFFYSRPAVSDDVAAYVSGLSLNAEPVIAHMN